MSLSESGGHTGHTLTELLDFDPEITFPRKFQDFRYLSLEQEVWQGNAGSKTNI